MASRIDILITDNDLVFANGDLAFGVSDVQHIQDTINAFPGWWKEYPQEGVGISEWVGSPANVQEMSKAIRLQLVNDGYSVNNPVIKFEPNGGLTINPNATI